MFEDSIDGIPAIHAAPRDAMERPLPTVFFFHGYRSSKEVSAFFGYMLARAGLRAILPEADTHGARFDGDDAVRLGRFYEILKRSIDELPAYRDFYERRGLLDTRMIGVAGTSMGGFVTLGCLARYDWIAAAASYMASGYFRDAARTVHPPLGSFAEQTREEHDRRLKSLADYEVTNRLHEIGSRPLFMWHGQRDEVVPYAESVRLQADLLSHGYGARLEFVGDAFATHRVSADGAARGVAFLARHLSSART
ncbi:esterase [Bradyrhizobium sp. UFLA05-112]